MVAAAAGSEQEQQFPDVAGFALEVFQEQNPVPGPSRVQSVHSGQKRESTNSIRHGEGSVSGHNLEEFLPCHDDLLPDAYPEPSSDEGAAAALVDAPLSSSFQGMDAESSFGHPVDLEDIQLQRLLPEQYPPSTGATSSSSSSSKAPDPVASGSGGGAGVSATSSSAPATSSPSSSKFLLGLPDLPSLPTLKGEDILPAAASAASTSPSPSSSGLILNPNGGFSANSDTCSGDERRSLNLGMAFTGIPTSLSSEPRASTSSSSNVNTNNNQQQHSSILGSMTGPLSKRLRTLHTMQQQSKDEVPKSNGLGTENKPGDAAEAVAVVPQSSSSRSHNNGDDQQQREQQQQQEQPTSNNNNNTKDGEHTNSGNSNDSNSSSDGSQAGSSGGPFLGGTTQTYSVTIETPPVAAVMKPKKIFHQKSLGEADLFDVFGKDTLEPGITTTITPSMTPTSMAVSRPRRQRKDRTVWCDECKMHYFECECPIHQAPLQIVDNPVQSRARASVPSSHLLLRQLRNGENGIFTKQKIPKGSRFGPMEGMLMRHVSSPSPSSSASTNHRRLSLLVRGSNKIAYELDVTNEETSNWMRYVRPAGSMQEQNILLDQDGEHLFFTTSRVIGPKQELRVWYSPHYASEWGLQSLHEENGEPDSHKQYYQ